MTNLIEIDEEKLNTLERSALNEAEQKLEAAKIMISDKFRVIGEALKEIRDGKLYRETFPTFEAYVWARWKISARRAYQFIEAGNIDHLVYELIDIPNERIAREILKAEPKEQRKAAKELAKISKTKRITAATVKDVVEQVKSESRGGLAAAKADANGEQNVNQVVHKASVEPEPLANSTSQNLTRKDVQKIIRDWWAENRQTTVAYTSPTADSVVKQIIELFK